MIVESFVDFEYEITLLTVRSVDPETGRPRKFAYAPGLVVVDGGQPQVAAQPEDRRRRPRW